VWVAQNRVKDSDLDESSPDHLGSALEIADAGDNSPPPATPALKPSAAQGPVVAVALREKETAPPALAPPPPAPGNVVQAATSPSNGTVVLDIEQGGIEVPSFLGKSVRGALEAAQDSGLELNPIGSGIAREQSPAPGMHVTAGSRVVVKFGR
jgi:cell division protein FtsI (penicillin-binding protein 3)